MNCGFQRQTDKKFEFHPVDFIEIYLQNEVQL